MLIIEIAFGIVLGYLLITYNKIIIAGLFLILLKIFEILSMLFTKIRKFLSRRFVKLFLYAFLIVFIFSIIYQILDHEEFFGKKKRYTDPNLIYISRPQMQTILDRRPEGASGQKIIDEFVKSGYVIEGVNDEGLATDTLRAATFDYSKF